MATALLAVAWASSATATHTAGSAAHVDPDLQTLEPANFGVQTAKTRGNGPRGGGTSEQRLVFDNEVMNLHTGPLEVRPTDEKCTTGVGAEGRIAVQRIYYDSNGDGGWLQSDSGYQDQPAGCMTFHAQHRHWHFDDFSYFELRTIAESAEVAGSSKMTFCIADVNRRTDFFGDYPGLEAFSPETEQYNQCSKKSPQGLSVAWGDLYPKGTTGQYITITNVADGDYCFVSTADPLDRLHETDETNNVADAKINLSTAADGSRHVSIVSATC